MAKTSEILVTNAANGTRLDAPPDPTRKSVIITNFGPNAIYLSFGNQSAGAKKGSVVPASEQIGPLAVDPAIGIWAIADAAAQATGAATVLSEF